MGIDEAMRPSDAAAKGLYRNIGLVRRHFSSGETTCAAVASMSLWLARAS